MNKVSIVVSNPAYVAEAALDVDCRWSWSCRSCSSRQGNCSHCYCPSLGGWRCNQGQGRGQECGWWCGGSGESTAGCSRWPGGGGGGCSQGFGVLSGFWSCSQGFGVKIGNLSEKSIKKGTFKPKIKKRALAPLF